MPTHKDVLQAMFDAKELGYIDIHDLKELLDFRKLAIDLFCLVDSENDQTLHEHELDEFWEQVGEAQGSVLSTWPTFVEKEK